MSSLRLGKYPLRHAGWESHALQVFESSQKKVQTERLDDALIDAGRHCAACDQRNNRRLDTRLPPGANTCQFRRPGHVQDNRYIRPGKQLFIIVGMRDIDKETFL